MYRRKGREEGSEKRGREVSAWGKKGMDGEGRRGGRGIVGEGEEKIGWGGARSLQGYIMQLLATRPLFPLTNDVAFHVMCISSRHFN